MKAISPIITVYNSFFSIINIVIPQFCKKNIAILVFFLTADVICYKMIFNETCNQQNIKFYVLNS